tara:strand:+ start:347 stop:460 length:114 start_codon:yes stop_codon:yes gene_type:complete
MIHKVGADILAEAGVREKEEVAKVPEGKANWAVSEVS